MTSSGGQYKENWDGKSRRKKKQRKIEEKDRKKKQKKGK